MYPSSAPPTNWMQPAPYPMYGPNHHPGMQPGFHVQQPQQFVPPQMQMQFPPALPAAAAIPTPWHRQHYPTVQNYSGPHCAQQQMPLGPEDDEEEGLPQPRKRFLFPVLRGTVGDEWKGTGQQVIARRVKSSTMGPAYIMPGNNQKDVPIVVLCKHATSKKFFGDYDGACNKLVKPDQGMYGLESSLTRVNGKRWERQRGVVQKVLSPMLFKQLHPVYQQAATKLLQDIQSKLTPGESESGKCLDIVALLTDAARDVIILGTLGANFPKRAEFEDQFQNLWEWHRKPVLQHANTDRRENIRKYMDGAKAIVREELKSRWERGQKPQTAPNGDENQESPEKENDNSGFEDACFVNALMKRCTNAREAFTQPKENQKDEAELEEGIGVEEVIGNVFSFLIAGFETAAATMMLCLLHLSNNPELQAEVKKEIAQHYPDDTGVVPCPAVSKCTLLLSCVRETLRMYPPVLSLPRKPTCPGMTVACPRSPTDPTLRDVEISSPVWGCLVAPHHDEAIFGAQTLQWNPNRWKENEVGPMLQQMMPWGIGPRRCPGSAFAIMEAQTMLAAVLNTYSVSLPGGEVELQACLASMKKTPTLRVFRDIVCSFNPVERPEASGTNSDEGI
eukprot:TRINITY_DN58653_c0_g1_i1.p1 TRINITY_DN58653_c0_g1~~TRINITY_DN58653_c0_g1_i1.p1  ORF type:complete len:619 (+),score=47.97 TRINITY_DN58653_c0_g1_i1:53-1909(+)